MNIVVVCPIPPPVDGRAQATIWLVCALQDAGHRVRVVNTHASPIAKALRCVVAAVSFVFSSQTKYVVVVASGESGLLVEAIPLFAARLRRFPSSLTHHSAHYIRADSTYLQLALAAAGPQLRHAVLDEAMGREFAERYAVEMSRVVVVDNSGLMPVPPGPDPMALRSGVVHLSNLSPAKGPVAVLDVAARTNTRVRLDWSVTPEASFVLEDARRRGVPFDALGPRYGEAKHPRAARRSMLPVSLVVPPRGSAARTVRSCKRWMGLTPFSGRMVRRRVPSE
ncbi:MAG: hypothetical protein JWR35_3891 [Marmoricola sp.]|nr:hypothetical protein [Marmoricola sp.]